MARRRAHSPSIREISGGLAKTRSNQHVEWRSFGKRQSHPRLCRTPASLALCTGASVSCRPHSRVGRRLSKHKESLVHDDLANPARSERGLLRHQFEERSHDMMHNSLVSQPQNKPTFYPDSWRMSLVARRWKESEQKQQKSEFTRINKM